MGEGILMEDIDSSRSGTTTTTTAAAAAEPALIAISIREFEEHKDEEQVGALERGCEAGLSLFTHLLGDPLCRVRNYPTYRMLVAEARSDNGNIIVGLIRAGLKQVARETFLSTHNHALLNTGEDYVAKPVFGNYAYNQLDTTDSAAGATSYVTAACISGLRISREYRRLGIARQLVLRVEEWCKEQGAQFVYIATETHNEASISLFTHKLHYTRFLSPAVLIQPVYAKPVRLPSHIRITRLPTPQAAALYRSAFAASHKFFPEDIDAVLSCPLNAGTWIAVYHSHPSSVNGSSINKQLELDGICNGRWTSDHSEKSAADKLSENGTNYFLKQGGILSCQSYCIDSDEDDVRDGLSWAVLSLWKLNDIMKFEMRGVSPKVKGYAAISRVIDKLIPWLTVPSLPNMFDEPFGVQIMYGLHGQGPHAGHLLQALCWHAHNVALADGCHIILTEMDGQDPLKDSVPHWKSLSEHDLWCVKPLLNQHDRVSSNCNCSIKTCMDTPCCISNYAPEGDHCFESNPDNSREENLNDFYCTSNPSLFFLDPRDF